MTTPGIDGGTVVVGVEADMSGFDRDLDRNTRNAFGRVERQAGASGKRVGGAFSGAVGGAAAGLAKLGGLAAGAFAGAAVVSGIRSVVDAASSYEESVSKVRTVFAGASPVVEAFGKTSAQALGISQNQALEAAGTYGNLFAAIGITGDKSAQMSTRLVTLAADLASFNNSTPEEALAALQSGLNGEAEPLRRFGVLLSDATIKQEAFATGISKSVKDDLTPAQKAQASYSLILKQTALAQGDVERTSGGLANTQRRLSAKVDDLKARLGRGLLPAALGAARGFEKLLDGGGKAGRALSKVQPVFRAFVDGLKGLGPGAGQATTPLEKVARVGQIVRDAFLTVARAFRERVLPVLAQVGGFVVDKIVPALGRLFSVLDTQVRPAIVAAYKSYVRNLVVAIRGLVVRIQEVAPKFAPLLKVLALVGGLILKFVVPIFLRLAGVVFRVLIAALGQVIGAIAPVVGAFGRLIEAGVSIGRRILPAVKAFVSGLLGFLGKILEGASKAFGWLPGIGPKLKEAERDFVAFQKGANAALNGITDKEVRVSIKVSGQRELNLAQDEKRQDRDRRKGPAGRPRVEGAAATGAVIRRPTIVLAGEAGPEAIVPLGRASDTPGNGPLGAGGSSVVQHFHVSRETPPDALMRAAAYRFRLAAG